MNLGIAQSMTLLIIALLAIVILLRILVVVHKQTGRVKELEMRMKAMEKMDVDPESITTTEQKEK
ncbi:MAG: hypothetical protein V4678_01305 [Patescibacteria group bacterium]